MPTCNAELNAFKLHQELQVLLDAYNHLVKDTNSEPLFDDEPTPATRASAALFTFMPDAEWEAAAAEFDRANSTTPT